MNPEEHARRDGLRAVARARRRRRGQLAEANEDDLLTEMGWAYKQLVLILHGERSALRPAELRAYLRMIRHELVIVRGWDAADPKIKWEKDAAANLVLRFPGMPPVVSDGPVIEARES